MNQNELLKNIPSVEKLVASLAGSETEPKIDHVYLVRCARQAVEAVRQEILAGQLDGAGDRVVQRAEGLFKRKLEKLLSPSLRRVINCTGIILHTGLGRSVFSAAALAQLGEVVRGYSNLEVDLHSGKRGDRTQHVEDLLRILTGAEAACIVNNNAAAVLIALNSLANRKQVIVSRGELIEIGGSFRIPAIMAKSGARMVEVGTTNKTHLADFREAIGPKTAGILHVHTSNYRIQGFTKSVPIEDLVALAHAKDLFVLHDLGGGVIHDFREFGLPPEPIASESLAAGCDIVTFSGDKVIGGPQCGILVGKRHLVDRIKKNPLMRAVRCDKVAYALLEATLRLFLHRDSLKQNHLVLRLLTASPAGLKKRACALQRTLPKAPAAIQIEVVESHAQAGSGTLPLEKIPSFALRLRGPARRIQQVAKQLRSETPPVIGYIRHDALYLDLRTVLEEDHALLAAAVRRVLGG